MWPFKRDSQSDAFSSYKQNMSLVKETRWSREYQNEDGSKSFLDSRFRDGSAAISLSQLKRQWSDWTDDEKLDFCQAVCHFKGRGFVNILRFVVVNGNDQVWQSVALTAAMNLPTDEAVRFLLARIESSEIGRRANYFQASWITKSAAMTPPLRDSLEEIWNSPGLMTSDSFCNWIAHDAIWCIDALVRLGEPTDQLNQYFEQLACHPTMSDSTTQWLGEHFGLPKN